MRTCHVGTFYRTSSLATSLGDSPAPRGVNVGGDRAVRANAPECRCYTALTTSAFGRQRGLIVNTLTLTRICLAMAVCSAACAGKEEDESNGDAGATENGTTGEPSDDDATGHGTTTGASAESSGGESTGEPTEAIYGGNVFDFLLEMGISDAVITVYDEPGLQTVSDADGNYELGPLPLDPPPIFLIEPNDDYFGSVRPVRTAEVADYDDVRLAQVSRQLIDDQIELLQNQEPAEADLEQSIIIVRLLHPQAVGATLELDPPPDPDTYYAPDSMARPVLGLSEIQFSLLPVVIYFNIAPADPHTYTFTVTHPTRDCTVTRPDFPTLAGHITLVEVSCPPS